MWTCCYLTNGRETSDRAFVPTFWPFIFTWPFLFKNKQLQQLISLVLLLAELPCCEVKGIVSIFYSGTSFFWRYYILCHMHYIYTRLVFCAGVILNSRQGPFPTPGASLLLFLLCRYIQDSVGTCNNRDLRTPQWSRLYHLSTHSLSVIIITHLWWMPILFSYSHCFLNSLFWILKCQLWFYHRVIWTEPF